MEKTRTTAVILFAFRLIPLGMRRAIFKAVFRLFYHASAKQRLIALHNLRNAFPEKASTRSRPSPRVFSVTWPSLWPNSSRFPTSRARLCTSGLLSKGSNMSRGPEKQGKGMLSVIGHFGNWELMTVSVPLVASRRCRVPAPGQPGHGQPGRWGRTKNGNSLIPKGGSGKKIIRLLRENKTIGILSDQNVATNEGVFVDFFGRPACTSVGTAVLALQSGAPVLPVFMPRMPDGRYKLLFLPPVEITRTDDYESDLRVNTQRFAKVVEDMVRKYPEQWFWIHQRWKTKPWQ